MLFWWWLPTSQNVITWLLCKQSSLNPICEATVVGMICFRLNPVQIKKVFVIMFCSNHFIKCKISHEVSTHMVREVVHKDWWVSLPLICGMRPVCAETSWSVKALALGDMSDSLRRQLTAVDAADGKGGDSSWRRQRLAVARRQQWRCQRTVGGSQLRRTVVGGGGRKWRTVICWRTAVNGDSRDSSNLQMRRFSKGAYSKEGVHDGGDETAT
jgi:hypothetical protein